MVRCWFFILGCLAVSALGCGNSSGRYPVSGDVTLKGQPLASGAIIFEGADGSRGGATIEDGKYSVPTEQGLLPGTYTVRLSAVQSQQMDGPPGPEATALERTNRDLVPPEFNAKSTLKLEVGPDSPSKFDIAIP